eukprot:NODE_2951_length_2117_cov_9.967337.p1 GENE.NODE_2951_length_2117_cov_9.967337~~NODE_2951_length_2117_cov_9.967337.p1  ORF type:complete len:605 (+),score=132.21 NODE_2951_length_2117_cov_9.967337:102-1916(+)
MSSLSASHHMVTAVPPPMVRTKSAGHLPTATPVFQGGPRTAQMQARSVQPPPAKQHGAHASASTGAAAPRPRAGSAGGTSLTFPGPAGSPTGVRMITSAPAVKRPAVPPQQVPKGRALTSAAPPQKSGVIASAPPVLKGVVTTAPKGGIAMAPKGGIAMAPTAPKGVIMTAPAAPKGGIATAPPPATLRSRAAAAGSASDVAGAGASVKPKWVSAPPVPKHSADASGAVARVRELCCLEGHRMFGRIAHEWHLEGHLDGGGMFECDACHCDISVIEAHYRCEECDYDYCMDCAISRQERGTSSRNGAVRTRLSLSQVLPGDILLVGPDPFDIHHVVLVTSPMKPFPAAASHLEVDPKLKEVWECGTIESATNCHGDKFEWFPTTSIYTRDIATGVLEYAGTLDEAQTLNVLVPPTPTKVVFHPCRLGFEYVCAPPLEQRVFEAAVQIMGERSQKWSYRTGVNALLRPKLALDPNDYQDKAARAVLLKDLRKQWKRRPICSSVAIKVWQAYCVLLARARLDGPVPDDAHVWSSSSDDEGVPRGKCSFPWCRPDNRELVKMHSDAEDAAVRHILLVMPAEAKRTPPSRLIEAITLHGWVIRQTVAG